MLRNTLIAAALLTASAGALAGHDDHVYGRVVSVEPNFVISFGSGRHQDGFRIRYEIGGQHYWTHSHSHPGHGIWVPRPYGHVVHHYRQHDRHDWRDDRRDRRHDRREDRRDDRRDDHHNGHHDRY